MTCESTFPGEIVYHDDSRYPTLARGFNQRWVGKPRYVHLCADARQVRAAVQRAVDHDLRITIQGRGHCYENFAVGNDGGVIVNLSAMNDVYRDEQTGWYCIEGGATLWDAYERLYRLYGVTIPGGSCATVGAGGHIVGGGYGLLSRLHGLTIDVLHAVEVVVVDAAGHAEIRTVSRDSTGDDELLMWGHLGAGGGTFGVVTKYLFRDPPLAPAKARILNLAWNWSDLDSDRFATLMSRYGEYLAANSDPGSNHAGLFTLLHLKQRAATQVTLTAQYVGDKPQILTEFKDAMSKDLPTLTLDHPAHGYASVPVAKPVTDSVGEMTWLYATQTLNGTGPVQRGKYKSAYMKKPFPPHQVDTMWKWLQPKDHQNSQALLQVDSYGCQINAVGPAATAIPQRSSIMKLQYQTYWTQKSQDAPNLAWIRGFYDEMYGPDGPLPDDTMDGCYVNYPDTDLKDWQTLYYKDAYARLQKVKARWDPLDRFNHEQSVKAPT